MLLLWKEKETHGKEPVNCKSEWDDNPQIETQTDRHTGRNEAWLQGLER